MPDTTPQVERQTLTVEEAAQLLGIGRTLAWDLIWAGELPSLRLGSRVLVPRVRLQALLSGQNQSGRSQEGL